MSRTSSPNASGCARCCPTRARLREPLDVLVGEKNRAFGELPVPVKTAASLAEALREVADPRWAAGRQFPLHAMLASAVLAFAVSDLFRFVQDLTVPQRRALAFRSAPDNAWRVPPPAKAAGARCWPRSRPPN